MKNDMNSIQGRKIKLLKRNEVLNSLRNSSLDVPKEKLYEFKNVIQDSYNQSSIIRKIAKVSINEEIENYRFKSIGFHHSIRVSELNDPTYYWKPYFSDIGRKIAQGERRYIHRRIARYVKGGQEKISTKNPDFSIINKKISELYSKDCVPDVILAPVNMLSEFYKYYRDKMDWIDYEDRVFIENCNLKVYWSHKYAELRSFIIFNSNASRWHKILDSEDRSMNITVAFGNTKDNSSQVTYWVESLGFYQILKPHEFRRINLTG